MTDVPAGHVPVEQLRALVRLLWPEEITPTAKRMIEQVCDQHEAGPGVPET